MLNNELSLAYSIHTNPGIYAVLLGSGVSFSAGIKTGWGIVLDMCRQLAALEGVSNLTEAEAESWYREKYEEEPRYDDLLERLGKTPDERQAILNKYFIPTEEEIEEGIKQPTAAHRSIAELVKKGYIKMILTTNFDRLMERALTDIGVDYDVAWNDDGFAGMRPYVHSKCTIIKLHGDFKDTRIKNTREELEVYSERQNQLLHRIFDEFGLIVAGWSGVWDEALKAAMLRTVSRRYSWYWLSRGEVQPEAQDITQHRSANVIQIDGADQIFTKLVHQVEALESMTTQNPLNPEIGRAMVKKMLRTNDFIGLHDLLKEEADQVISFINSVPTDTYDRANSAEFFRRLMKQYYTKSETLLHMVAAVCYFAEDKKYFDLVKKIIESLYIRKSGGYTSLINLAKLPTLLVMYTTGIASYASGNLKGFYTVIVEPKSTERLDIGRERLLFQAYAIEVFREVPKQSFTHALPDREVFTLQNRELNDWLENVFRPYFTGTAYQVTFDTFEFLYSFAYINEDKRNWAPPGCFLWRSASHHHIRDYVKSLVSQGENHALSQVLNLGREDVDVNLKIYSDFLQRVSQQLVYSETLFINDLLTD
ncbi:SIR2 family protein [Aneurinibacillus tyrosinisolvens]|uniref:SIR2 family protein n=1 Tax=Aneurinibacillus tyrosinisolvens TaxID=1443435 RepID=UPI00069AAE78|nr:SIR2 family protein [Aneurinibacillus tyrosinisolvens]